MKVTLIKITTQKALQSCSKLDFCYLCGKPFVDGEATDRDHVPPKAIFLPADRDDPLILPTHPACNQGESGQDELVGQLVSALHRKLPRPERLRVKFTGGRQTSDGTPIVFTENVNLIPIVWRWVRGFHAALYAECLPVTSKFFLHVPFPAGRRNGEKIVFDPILPQQSLVPEEIKKNRIAKTLDVLECCHQKCSYESVFVRADDGRPICMWALRLYDWENLADPRWPHCHGCIGSYEPPSGIPSNAAVGTKLEFPFPNTDPFNPFEQ